MPSLLPTANAKHTNKIFDIIKKHLTLNHAFNPSIF